jgi:hypothetical protein
MTFRQRFRYLYFFYKKVWQIRRKPNETELREILAQTLDEFNVTLRSIGALTIVWAEVDIYLHYIDGILILNAAMADKVLPRTSLVGKMEFLKDGFDVIKELAPLRDKIAGILAELERLRTIRNDIIHGIATEQTLVAVRKVMRVETKGKDLNETYRTYSIGEIAYAAVDAVKLRNSLISLFADTVRILHPDQAKQFLSELLVAPVGE